MRLFRDIVRDGIISFRRGWAYVVFVFFYAGLLFALAQYAYFAYMDKGYFVQALQQMATTAEATQMMTQYGIADTFADSMQQLQAMRPIDLSLNVLTTNIILGILLGMPIAAVMKQDSLTPNS